MNLEQQDPRNKNKTQESRNKNQESRKSEFKMFNNLIFQPKNFKKTRIKSRTSRNHNNQFKINQETIKPNQDLQEDEIFESRITRTHEI